MNKKTTLSRLLSLNEKEEDHVRDKERAVQLLTKLEDIVAKTFECLLNHADKYKIEIARCLFDWSYFINVMSVLVEESELLSKSLRVDKIEAYLKAIEVVLKEKLSKLGDILSRENKDVEIEEIRWFHGAMKFSYKKSRGFRLKRKIFMYDDRYYELLVPHHIEYLSPEEKIVMIVNMYDLKRLFHDSQFYFFLEDVTFEKKLELFKDIARRIFLITA